MYSSSVPIIRLEVDRMKYAICTALTQYEAQLSVEIQAAVDEYCKPENIDKVISSAVSETLSGVLRQEVEDFFRKGDGRDIVREAVYKRLKEAV